MARAVACALRISSLVRQAATPPARGLLWVNLALENLEKPLYAATCAGLSYDVSDAFFESGVDLYVGGLAGGALCGKTIRCVNGGAP